MSGTTGDKPCCGACGHAAEVMRAGGPAPNEGPHLRVDLAPDGTPRGAALILREGDREPKIVPVDKPRVVLGRTPPADVVVPMAVLSRRQCAFDFSSGEVFVEDLESTCGTYVNDEQVAKRALRSGDQVRAGDLIIEVRT
jgi:hypothetical protein